MVCRLCPSCKLIIHEPRCICGWTEVKPIITMDQLLNGHHLNPAYIHEYDAEVKKNLNELLTKLNSLLQALNITNVKVTSGWRPQAYNLKIGGARRSRHIIGQAVDLSDRDGKIKAKIMANLHELKKRGMSMEDGRYTPTWCHLQFPPPRSGRTVFIPYAGPPRV